MRLLLGLLTISLLGGCHSRFKKHVGSIDHVRADMPSFGGPVVNLGQLDDDSLLGAAVNIGQAIQSQDLTGKINGAVRPDDVQANFVLGLDDALGKRPFDVRDKSRHTLQIEMLHYGIDVPGLGQPGALTYVLRTELYKGSGKKVYKATHHCALPFAEFDSVSVVLGTVDNAKAIREMKRKELRALFDEGAAICAERVAVRIRKHGG